MKGSIAKRLALMMLINTMAPICEGEAISMGHQIGKARSPSCKVTHLSSVIS